MAQAATSPPGAEFDNNVVTAPIAGWWFFFWPWAEPIGSVTRVADAARRIVDDLCLGGDGTGQPVTSLAVWRMLQHARAGISSPRLPSSPPGAAAARHQPPRPSQLAGRSMEIRGSKQTITFTRGELAKAIAALLGHEPRAPVSLAINGASEPRADAMLRERRTTVIQV